MAFYMRLSLWHCSLAVEAEWDRWQKPFFCRQSWGEAGKSNEEVSIEMRMTGEAERWQMKACVKCSRKNQCFVSWLMLPVDFRSLLWVVFLICVSGGMWSPDNMHLACISFWPFQGTVLHTEGYCALMFKGCFSINLQFSRGCEISL